MLNPGSISKRLPLTSDLGGKPSGLIRITAIVLPQYPDIQLEISSDYRMVDIAAKRFDIGGRWGDQVEKDMVAVRITRAAQMMIVGSPDNFTHRPVQ